MKRLPIFLCTLALAGGAVAQVLQPLGSPTSPAPATATPRADDDAATRNAPSRPSVPSRPGDAVRDPTTVSGAGRESPLAPDPRGGTWGNAVVPQVGTGLENVMNTGVGSGRYRGPVKVCPPGLVNRDNNCVAPAAGILR